MISGAEMQRRLREFVSPTFGYRRGADGGIEKDLFDGSLPDGWVDSPAHVDGKPAAEPNAESAPQPEPAPAAEESPTHESAAPGGPLAPPYDQYGFADLRDEYKRRAGNGVKFGTSFEDLVKLLDGLDRGEA